MRLTGEYFMTHADEPRRLREKVNPSEWYDRYFTSPEASLTRILDAGCGPGVLAGVVARRRPQAHVVGLDLDPRHYADSAGSAPPNLAFRQGSVYELPFGDASFDLAYSRFLFQYLSRPEEALRELVRVVRPGGLILLQDLDGQLLWHWPVRPDFQSRLAAALDLLSRDGFDPYVGRKLWNHAKSAGLSQISLCVEPYHLICGKISVHERNLWEMKFRHARRGLLARGMSAADVDALVAEFMAVLEDEGSMTYSNVMTLCARVPAPPSARNHHDPSGLIGRESPGVAQPAPPATPS